MSDDEILTRTYDVSVDALWNAVKRALTTLRRVSLKGVDDQQRRATFTTGLSLTSWGENVVAVVEPRPPGGSLLRVTGQAHTSFLTSQWGEKLHQGQLARNLTKAIERVLGSTSPAGP